MVAAAAALVLMAVSGKARGQTAPPDEGPIVVGERRGKYTPLELKEFSAELEFTAESHRDRISQPGLPPLEEFEYLLREAVNLSFDVYVGHKNLLDVSGTTKLGLDYRHDRSDSLGTTTNELSLANLYDVRGLLLGEGPMPVTMYSRRDQTRLNREFAGTLDSITMESGVIANIRSEVAPTTLQYFHREQDDSDALGIADSTLDQDTFSLQSDLRLADHQRLELSYTFDSVQETQGSAFRDTYDRHDGTFTHLADFGAEYLHNLRSSLHFYSQTGRFDRDTLRLDEQLVLHHSNTLETRSYLTLEQLNTGGTEQRLVSGSTIVRHKLFDSLISSGTVGGSHLEIPGAFTSDEGFVNGALDYTKKVPYGRLNASVGIGYNHQDNSDRGTDIPVADETYTFSDPFPVTLGRRNIVESSIVLTTLAHVPLFPGLDYTVQAFPDRVELRRVLGGAITNGQAVLITYDVGPEPGNVIETTSPSVSVRLTFEEGMAQGLSLYTTYRRADHTLHAEDPSRFVLDDYQELLLGVEYRLGDLTMLLEQVNHDSTVSPYDLWRFQATYDRRLGRDSSLSLEYTHEAVEYSLLNERLDLDRATGRWTQRVDPSLSFSLRLQYRNESDNVSGDVQGLDQAIELRWRKRQTTVFASFHNTVLDGDSSDQTSQSLVFGFRRSF